VWGAGLTAVVVTLLAAPVGAGDASPFAARAGVDVARSAAAAWAPDAALIYIENDEPVAASGTAARWGYLFYSSALDEARAYSVRDEKIVVAEKLDMKFEAPPLALDWIDSGAAVAVAERVAATELRGAGGGRLSTMLLMRGAFQDKDADQTTWTLIYTSPSVPSLFIVVDASEGKVRRTWRG